MDAEEIAAAYIAAYEKGVADKRDGIAFDACPYLGDRHIEIFCWRAGWHGNPLPQLKQEAEP